eukprot:13096-Heterococcus_DN1.PRE.2
MLTNVHVQCSTAYWRDADAFVLTVAVFTRHSASSVYAYRVSCLTIARGLKVDRVQLDSLLEADV